MINGYRDVSDKNSEFNIGVNKLSSAFTYLKFSIGKAFAENALVKDTLNGITDGLTNLAQWFNDNPDIAVLITTLSGALFVLGSTSLVLGTFRSVASGLVMTFKDFGSALGFLSTKLPGLEKIRFFY